MLSHLPVLHDVAKESIIWLTKRYGEKLSLRVFVQ